MTAELNNIKMKRAMGKAEVEILLNLIENNPLITSKTTNGATNRLKEVGWSEICNKFNAAIGGIPRSKEQLKLKWDNLKKSARKRAANVRMNNIQTGGGKSDIPADDILDKVASLLGSTCSGFSVTFGGDADGMLRELQVGNMSETDEDSIVDESTRAEVRVPDTPSNPSTSGERKRNAEN